MRKLRIAVFTDSFFPAGGGTEQATYNLCKNLKNLGHEILLFAPDYHREQSFNEFEVFRVKSIKLSDNDMMVLYKKEIKNIVNKSKEFSPDIIYFCTASGMAKAAIRVAKTLNKPLIATIHTKFKEAFYNSCKSIILTKILLNSLVNKLKHADIVTTVSNDMANQLHEYGLKKNVIVIKNGINNINQPIQNPEKSNDGPFNFLYCGHLIKTKNIQFSIKSLSLLKNKYNYDNFVFYLVGAGPYKKKLEALIKKEGLTDKVVFTGFIKDREKLSELYKNANLFLFPSTFDTDGLVICEAASRGTPTLTIKGYGASERLTDKQTGFLSEYDVEKFTDYIYEIIQDNDLYKHVCNNTSNIKGETWLDVAKKYENLFNKIIKD